jgi:hypothetical protein
MAVPDTALYISCALQCVADRFFLGGGGVFFKTNASLMKLNMLRDS